jgi:hypothetical protein
MCIVAVGTVWVDVGHGQEIELRLSAMASCIDGEQDRPGDEAANKGQNDHHLEEAHKQEAVDGLVVKNPLILDVFEVFDPPEYARTWCWRLALLAQVVEVCPGGIDSAVVLAHDEKDGDKSDGDDGRGHEGGDHAGQRVGAVPGLASLSSLQGSHQHQHQASGMLARAGSVGTYGGRHDGGGAIAAEHALGDGCRRGL